MDEKQNIRELLNAFQDGYAKRDVKNLEKFMELFTPDVEIIGTNGVKPGIEEWYLDQVSAKSMIKSDWETWGDLKLDLENASIKVNETIGWIAAYATLTKTIGSENYASFLEFTREFILDSKLSPQLTLEYILRGGTNTIFELTQGENFVWPLRFTSIVTKFENVWRFCQIHFSYPTIYFPDVRIL